MTLRKAVLINNPNAGQRRGARPAAEVARFCQAMKSHGVEVDVLNTSGKDDAATLTERALNSHVDTIIVRGGDGTVHEVLQGLGGKSSRVAVWPAGTANVLARQLGLPSDARAVAETIARGNLKPITLGCATDERTNVRRYFFMLAGVGLDASVVRNVRPRLKRRVGQVAYWFSGLSHLAHWRPEEFFIEANGETYPATYAAIGKAPWYGGGLAITPRARLDAAEFEVCIIHTHSRIRYLRLLGHAMRGGAPEGTRGVTYIRASRVRAHGSSHVQADGELIGELPMTFEIVPERLEIIVP
jgi:YegS/Rv2252/BmrU family lipid kinase